MNAFVNLTLHDVVRLEAYTLTPDFYFYVKKALIDKVKNKCTNSGYICDIYDLKIDVAKKQAETLDDSVIVEVTYNAKVCNPQPGMYIVGKVTVIKDIIMAVNGPIRIVIRMQDYNNKIFKLLQSNNLHHIHTNVDLQIGDYIKILIKSTKNIYGNKTYGIIGYIDDILDEQASNEFMYKELFIDNQINVDNEIIDMNEDYTYENIESNITTINKIEENYIQDI